MFVKFESIISAESRITDKILGRILRGPVLFWI